jgi:hypothetical protein
MLEIAAHLLIQANWAMPGNIDNTSPTHSTAQRSLRCDSGHGLTLQKSSSTRRSNHILHNVLYVQNNHRDAAVSEPPNCDYDQAGHSCRDAAKTSTL